MKKLAFLIALICISAIAQEPIEKKLGDFNKLKVFNGLTVTLKKAVKPKIVITGSQSEDVSVKNSDGVLKIRLKFPERFTADDVSITLHYTNQLDVIDANEGGKIISEETVKQQHLEVKAQEGAKVILPVDTKHLVVKTVSGGIIKLNGVSKNQTVEATTGAIYNGYNLQSEQTVVTAASGAKAEVKVSEVLDAKVRFGGTIHYKGTPEVLKTKKIIGGVIKAQN